RAGPHQRPGARRPCPPPRHALDHLEARDRHLDHGARRVGERAQILPARARGRGADRRALRLLEPAGAAAPDGTDFPHRRRGQRLRRRAGGHPPHTSARLLGGSHVHLLKHEGMAMRGTYRIRSALLGSLLVLAGCPLEMDEEPTGGEKVVELEPGLFRIDATASDSWVLFDLDEGAEAEEDGGWDLAFQRSLIAANGPKDVMVAKLDDVDFDAVEAAPESGYWLDPGRPTAGDGRGGGGDGLAFHNGDDWYEYDIGTHVLTPKARRVYVVVTDAGNAFAVQILRYYDDAGTAAVLTIRVKAIEPPVDPEEPERPNPEEPEEPEPGTYEEVRIDARDADTWVFFDFDTGEETDETSG